MKKIQLVERIESLRKRSNLLLKDVKEIMSSVPELNSEIPDLKAETRGLEAELVLLTDCAELIDDKAMLSTLSEIKDVIGDADSKRAVHLDREVTQ